MLSIHSIDHLLAKRGGPATVQRLRWIDGKLYWTGEMSRSDLMRRFGISASQASVDLAAYKEIAPGNILLDHADKRLKAPASFVPVFIQDAKAWIEEERQAQTVGVPDILRANDPWIAGPPDVLRALVRAASNRSCVSVDYVSLAFGTRERRTLSPHTLVDVNDRLHARAFDHGKGRFGDFVLSRMSKPLAALDITWVAAEADAGWQDVVGVDLVPDPDMPAALSATAMGELGLPPGGGRLEVRQALAFYLLQRIGYIEPSRRRYVCDNFDDLADRVKVSST